METKPFQKLDLFKNLSRTETESLFHDSETVQVEKGQVLFEEGDIECHFYVVLEGEILVYKAEAKIAIRRSGDYFGEMALIDDSPRAANAKALKPSILLKVGEASFEALISANSKFALKLLKTLVARTREDMGELNQGHKKLKQQKRKTSFLNRILDDATSEIYAFDPSTLNITQMNKRSLENLGHSLDEVKTLTAVDILAEVSEEAFRTLIQPLISEAQTLLSYEGSQRRKDGSHYPVEIRFQLMETEQSFMVVAIVQDISERVKMEQHIRQLAYFDSLTFLPNRNKLLDDVSNITKTAENEKSRFALFHLDLDGFKAVNDSLGQQGGDILLREVCIRLSQRFNESASLYRLRGDEFAILISHVDSKESAVQYAKTMMRLIDTMFHIHSYDIRMTCSIGITLFPFHGNSATTLLENADLALTQAKHLGKAQYNFYDSSLEPLALNKLTLVSGIKNGLEKGEFYLAYQPKVNAKTKKIVGAEALVRWKHPEMGRVSPGDFIPAAEESRLIIPMGEWVFSKACAQLKKWHGMGFDDFTLAVNFSGIQFQQEGAVSLVRNILESPESADHGLELELTESVLVENSEEAIEKLKAFHDLGLHLSIDDFGTGYSSMKYLKDMPIDCLKVDQCFVRGIETKANQAIARTIVNLAKMLGLTTVAEGVETEEEENLVEMIGCDLIQGFLFFKPISPEELEALLKKQSLDLASR